MSLNLLTLQSILRAIKIFNRFFNCMDLNLLCYGWFETILEQCKSSRVLF